MLGLFLNLLDTQTEKEKFEELYNTYKNLLYWIALKRTNSNEDAEECVQETFFYVARHFDKIDEVASKKTKIYLSAIVTGFAIDIYNNSVKFEMLEIDHEDNTEDLKYFESFEAVELNEVIRNVFDDESRVFFYLKYLYNYKSREIAEIYNVKDSYVRKKLEYARRKIRKQLEERS